MKHAFKFLIASATLAGIAVPAVAGGLERGGHNIDLLFDPARFAGEASVTYVMPQRRLKNVVDTNPDDGTAAGAASVMDSESYFVPRLGLKAGIGDSADCLVDYSQPWGAHTNPGIGWAGANSNIQTKIESHGYGATCSYGFDTPKGRFRVIGGLFHHEVEGFQEKLGAVIPPALGSGVARLDMEGDGWGWRAGASYEIPEIALRASLVYNSEVRLDNLSGTLDLTGVPGALDPSNPFLGRKVPVFGDTAMPDSLEFKLQAGIAPGWLAFGSVKWVDWSQLQSVAFCPEAARSMACTTTSGTAAASLNLLYRDGWTVTGGVGHRFNEHWSGMASLSWDRGTSAGKGAQTDVWLATAGLSYSHSDSVELRFGGAAGVMTSGSSGTVTGRDGLLYGNDVAYEFGNDFVGALSASLKVKF